MSKNLSTQKDKRGQGEWCFYEQKNGKWTARKQFGRKADGKPNVVALYGGKGKKGLAEVRRKAKEYETKLASNQSSQCTETLYDYLNRWLITYKLNTVKAKTYDCLEDALEIRVKPYPIANIQLFNLTIDICQEYINELTNSSHKYSLATITKTYNMINSCLKLAVGKGDIPRNPMAYVQLPSKDNVQTQAKEVKFFTEEEVKLICAEAQSKCKNGVSAHYYGEVIVLLLHTGMRIGECLALKWKDIDFDNGVIRIDSTITVVNNRSGRGRKLVTLDTSPKTSKSFREIPMSAGARQALLNIRDNTRTPITPNSYIVVSKNGVLSSQRNVRRAFDNILEHCGIKQEGINDGYGLHSLRHTFVSILLAKGIDIKIISELVGHEKVSTTYNIYAHLMPTQKEASIRVLDEL